jgi:farnesyl diphosphate synthase/geranylgeranyl diphosphate synthase type II
MDDDDFRHNQLSSHKVYGEAQAIIAGDALQALAFQVICNDPLLDYETKLKLLGLLSESSYKMAEGQSIDLSIVSQNVELDLLNDMHKKKTGALLSCAINFGALLNDTSDKDLSILKSFSSNIGLAYQVQDDVLDVTTPDEILGKRQNSDSEKNKPSYPSIIGIDESIEIFKNHYQKALDETTLLSVNAEPLRVITRQLMNRTY